MQPPLTIAAFYHFAALDDAKQQRESFRDYMRERDIRGTIIFSPEGVNGTVSGSKEAIDALLAALRALPGFAGLEAKFSEAAEHPFGRSKTKLKPEIISVGEPVCAASERTGTYVEPQDWNALIADPEVTLIDTRNAYEVHLGSFPGALNPGTRRFRDMAAFTKRQLNPEKNKKVAMFCTGGIRCEKYSAYLRQQGFEEVYHLKGGILRYLEEMPAEQSTWQGECFVFDERVAVGQDVMPAEAVEMCAHCGHPLLDADKAHPEYIEGERCGYCDSHRTPKGADPVAYWDARYE